MFGKHRETPYKTFDSRVKSYLIYLAYVKNSLSLSISQKSDVLKSAEGISRDIFVSVEKIKTSRINQFNVKEFEASLIGLIKRLDRVIVGQMKLIEKITVIDKDKTHSVREAVESLVSSGPNVICFTQDHVDRLLSVSKYLNPPEKPMDVRKETAKAVKTFDDEMSRVGYKALQDILEAGQGSAENSMPYFRAVCIINEKLDTASVALMSENDFTSGLAFLSASSDSFTISYREPPIDIRIEASVASDRDRVRISVIGSLIQEGSDERFSIDKRYFASSKESAINSFKLRRLLDLAGAGKHA